MTHPPARRVRPPGPGGVAPAIMGGVRALTIRQPWATMIALGVKNVENRTRPFTYRGPLAIHAGRGWMAPTGRFRELVDTTATARGIGPDGYPLGAFVAVAELTDCHPANRDCCPPWGFDPRDDAVVHHLVLARVRPLPHPIPARGTLGLWRPAPGTPLPPPADR